MTTVLGINMSHYSSACLIRDGRIVALIGEERLNRIKYSADFPEQSIKKVMEIGGVEGKDIDLVAVGTRCEIFDSNKAQKNEYRFTTRAVSTASRLLPISLNESDFLRNSYVFLLSRYRKSHFFRNYLPFFESMGIGKEKIKYYDHHTCHTATGHYLNPWKDEPVLIFTCDGNGDGICASVSVGQGDEFERKILIPSIHSIGGLYARATKFLGMSPWQDEYKVMGMAPWGDKAKSKPVLEKLRKLWTVEGLRFKNRCGYAGDALVDHLNREFKNTRFDYFCYALQTLLEEIMTEWIRNNIRYFGPRKIAGSGGSFLNVKANNRITELDEVEDFFIFPAAGDDSISVGAAILGYVDMKKDRGESYSFEPLNTMYFGEPIDEHVERFVENMDKDAFIVTKPENINEEIANLLAQNEMVARCSGRMEYGPRALGNRSILANPSDFHNVQRLNFMIKCRDFWMPFAGTVLDKYAHRYLINPKNIKGHYMVIAFPTVPDNREQIQAAIHQSDFSMRPQILEREYNPDYYDIIEKFEEKTGIGAVLNTSLNLHGDAMVNLPEEAFHVLTHSGLTYLALNDYLIAKRNPDKAEPYKEYGDAQYVRESAPEPVPS